MIDFLKSVKRLHRKVEDQHERVLRLDARCQKMTASYSDQPCGGGGNKDSEELKVRLTEERDKLAAMMLELTNAETEVEAFLDALPDEEQACILRLRYVSCLGWRRVRRELRKRDIYYAERTVYDKHDKALIAAEEIWRDYDKRKI